MSELGIAIVGAGGIANAHIVAASESNGKVKVVAVVDPNEANRSAAVEKTGAVGFASVEELFASDIKPGGAVVCTPPSVRIEITEALLDAGIAVLAEKPIAHNAEDAARLVEIAAQRPGVVTAMGYCHRFAPAMIEFKRRAESGDLGRLVRFENVFACTIPGMNEKWMSDPAVSGGGSFIDTGCHSLDLFHFLLGDLDVLATSLDHAWDGRGESSATCLVRSKSGVAGSIFSGWIEPARFQVNMVGTDAMLSYDYEKPTEIVRLASDGTRDVLEIESHEVRFTEQLVAFADAVAGTRHPNLATFGDGLKVAEDVESALRDAIKVI